MQLTSPGNEQGLKSLNATETKIFWWSLYLMPFIWLLLALVAILKLTFDYLLIVLVALV